jgi:anti-anti-sigma regulatory factor
MDNLKIHVISNEKGLATKLTFGGLLVVENAHRIKRELVGILNQLSDSVEIEISEADNIDLSFIQLMVSFVSQLNEKSVKFKFIWKLDEDQQALFESVGLSDELFMNE